MTVTATRYHDISCGHRVVGHESKCRYMHGHNYRIHFTCVADKLDSVGRVIDFGVMKEKLCMWLENNWDHKFLAWHKDDLLGWMSDPPAPRPKDFTEQIMGSIVWVPFNPTAENMAEHLRTVVGPMQLMGTGISVFKVVVEETAKCSATSV